MGSHLGTYPRVYATLALYRKPVCSVKTSDRGPDTSQFFLQSCRLSCPFPGPKPQPVWTETLGLMVKIGTLGLDDLKYFEIKREHVLP